MRNRCVFDGRHPDARLVLQEINEQANLWKLAGAKALGELLQGCGCGCLPFIRRVCKKN